jgi:hypothetical protein
VNCNNIEEEQIIILQMNEQQQELEKEQTIKAM